MKPVRELIARLTITLKRRGMSAEDAEDCVQEAFAKFEDYRRTHAVDQPEGFIVRTALNAATDRARANQRRGRAVTALDQDFRDATPGPSDIFEARDRLRRLNACIDRLAPRARAVLLAHRLEGLSYAEIARREGLSVSGVEKSIARSVAALVSGMEDA